ncbi:glycerophosphodiester phosphodiesterase family protein [Propionicicella superfundia]|uniref:glycerophosphodiester phosphodiesterase family protein n=1 Tax=Propionicicella superfundia TaxID=348582 RepID=UPI000407F4AF|nr:glycerophosphodiester phosphodiesterase family protein [Propionicicella superfundia]
MLGLPDYAALNSQLGETLRRAKPAVVAHRGLGHASIAPNTIGAVRAAVRSGAEVVQIPVSASADMYFWAFHDGFEPEHLGIERNIQTLTATEVRQQSYIWRDRPGRTARVQPLLELLGKFAGGPVLFTIDRSWWRWPQLLVALDGLRMPGQLMLKAPAWEMEAISRLRRHPTKYPFVPICSTEEEVEDVLRLDELNTVGLELITTTPQSPWFDPDVIEGYHRRGLFILVNSVTLTTGIPQFGGYEDEDAIFDCPAAAWQPLFDLGVDAIQTDWPWLLRAYRDSVQR